MWNLLLVLLRPTSQSMLIDMDNLALNFSSYAVVIYTQPCICRFAVVIYTYN